MSIIIQKLKQLLKDHHNIITYDDYNYITKGKTVQQKKSRHKQRVVLLQNQSIKKKELSQLQSLKHYSNKKTYQKKN